MVDAARDAADVRSGPRRRPRPSAVPARTVVGSSRRSCRRGWSWARSAPGRSPCRRTERFLRPVSGAAMRPGRRWRWLEHELRPDARGPIGWLVAGLAEHALWQGDHETALAWFGMTSARPAAADGADAGLAAAVASLRLVDASRPRRLALAARAVADAKTLARATRGDSAERLAATATIIRAELGRFERRRALAAGWRAELLCASAELRRAKDPGSREEVRAWGRAAARAAELGRPYAEAYADWRLAEALLAGHGARERATSVLLDGPVAGERPWSRAPGARDGAACDAGEASPRAHGRRRPRSGPDVPAPFGLTDRELEVLELLAAGESNREIGEKLYISPRTASVHVSNILGKMGVSGHVEAASIAYRLGLVRAPDDVRDDRCCRAPRSRSRRFRPVKVRVSRGRGAHGDSAPYPGRACPWSWAVIRELDWVGADHRERADVEPRGHARTARAARRRWP